MYRKFQNYSFSFVIWILVLPLYSQAPLASPASVANTASPQNLPQSLQMKKTVVFLEADCLHDYSADIAKFKKEDLLKMDPAAEANLLTGIQGVLIRLSNLKPSASKITQGELTSIRSPPVPQTVEQMSDLIAERLALLKRMSDLSDEDLNGLTPAELSVLPAEQSRGTGFLVGFPDERLPKNTKDPQMLNEFLYLVTKRHVAEPGSQSALPCKKPLGNFVYFNKKQPGADRLPQPVSLGRHVSWTMPEDSSVDLAVLPVTPSSDVFDIIAIPTNLFVTEKMIDDHIVVEGDPVIFSGLFIQTFDQLHTLEPIIRSGALALIPNTPMATTMQGKPGRVFLAEAHAFGGNSGSPMFIDPSRFQNVIGGPNYLLLGVVSGEMIENADLTINVTASLSASVGANSGISVVVPASELQKILNGEELQGKRDLTIANLSGKSR